MTLQVVVHVPIIISVSVDTGSSPLRIPSDKASTSTVKTPPYVYQQSTRLLLIFLF